VALIERFRRERGHFLRLRGVLITDTDPSSELPNRFLRHDALLSVR